MRKDRGKSTNGRPAPRATKEREPLAVDDHPPLQPPHANPDVAHRAERVEGQENQEIERLTRRCDGTKPCVFLKRDRSQHSGPSTRRHVVFGGDSAHIANCASLVEVDLPIQQQAVQLDAGARKEIIAAAVLARLEDPEVAK